MPPHIKLRGDYYYLIDGNVRKSLGTDKKGLAQFKLEQYIRGEFGLGPKITIKEYYDKWTEQREKEYLEGLLRKSAIRDYRNHFRAYVLPELGQHTFSEITVAALTSFRSKLLKGERSLKTARNIIDSSFRAMWRAARKEKLTKEDPFELLEWPAMAAPKPDPFTAEERDRIIAWWYKNDFFYYPLVAIMFGTGMRPSEAWALRWPDVDLSQRTIVISKSRNLGKEGPPKTKHSGRTITVSEEIAELLKILPSRELGLEYVFVNKLGRPMSSEWAKANWDAPLDPPEGRQAQSAKRKAQKGEKLGIRYRKFYATRHTFITEAIKRGESPLAVAQYCGTSLTMIQADYCGTLNLDRTIFAQSGEKQLELLASPTGFEPVLPA